MKIRSQADVEALDQKIKTELGVDIGKYRNEEVVEQISSLLIFPIYVISWTVRPVILSFLLYIALYFIIDLVHVQYLLYAVLGLVLFLISGLFGGLFLCGLASRQVQRVLRTLTNLFRFDQTNLANAAASAGSEGKILPMYLAGVSGFQGVIDKILGIAVRVVQVPIGLLFTFFAGLTWLFVWLIN